MKRNYLLIFILFLSFLSCSNDSANNTVNKFFGYIKKNNYEKASEYLLNGNIDFKNKSELLNDDVIDNLLSKLEYKILSNEKLDENTTLVTVEITSIDFLKILDETSDYILNDVVYQNMSDEEVKIKTIEEIKKRINNKNSDKSRNEVLITVVKTDNKYKIDTSKSDLEMIM